jgi:hypothetical protein
MGGTLSKQQARRIIAAAGLGAGASLAWAGAAQAATTYTVGTTDDTSAVGDCASDNTDCSLRQAITLANGNAGADTIAFHTGLTGTLTLGSDLPAITDPVSINGPGAAAFTIDGNDAHRIFDVKPGTLGATVLINSLTLTGGNPNGSTTDAESGGAILNETADLSLADAIITGNTAASYGPAIYSGCDTQCGGASGDGDSANLTLARVTISGNDGGGTGGGTVYLNYGGATIFSSTINENSAQWGGGFAIFQMQDPVTFENTTITRNTVDSDSGIGGGIYMDFTPGGVTIENSTIAGNSALDGGGVYDKADTGFTTPNQNPVLHNTIVAANSATDNGPDLFNNNGSVFDSAFSLIGSPSFGGIHTTVPGSNIVGTDTRIDPKLGPLVDNGGDTLTMAPLAGSPAIDKGDDFGVGVDQRGLVRPVDLPNYKNSAAPGANGSDIGAVELQTNPGGGDENAFTHSSPRLNKKKGTATVTFTLPDPGTLTVLGGGAASVTAQLSRAHSSTSQVTVTIRAAGKAKKKLKSKGKARVQPTITFLPTSGSASVQLLPLTLRKKHKK